MRKIPKHLTETLDVLVQQWRYRRHGVVAKRKPGPTSEKHRLHIVIGNMRRYDGTQFIGIVLDDLFADQNMYGCI